LVGLVDRPPHSPFRVNAGCDDAACFLFRYAYVRRRRQVMGDTGARGLSSFGFTSVSWGHDGQKVEVKRIITQREYKVRHVAAAAAVLRVVWFGLVWLGLVGFGLVHQGRRVPSSVAQCVHGVVDMCFLCVRALPPLPPLPPFPSHTGFGAAPSRPEPSHCATDADVVLVGGPVLRSVAVPAPPRGHVHPGVSRTRGQASVCRGAAGVVASRV